jgi:uncharacterized protein (DUF302 family)
MIMNERFANLCKLVAFSLALTFSASGIAHADGMVAPAIDDGIIKVKSAYSKAETIARLKQDIADKGIRFFDEIDQSKLAADAGVQIRPSTLLVFGNPPLGTLFIRSNSLAGLDWPVRLLVFEDEQGQVWTAYTDFKYIARRHDIHGMDQAAFDKATGVIASITSSVKAR